MKRNFIPLLPLLGSLLMSASWGGAEEVRPIKREKAPSSQRSVPNRMDWTTMQSTYTHDESGQRVDQYSHGVNPTMMVRQDYMRSGYRHTRSTLQAGFGSDNYHTVEQWGGDVRPYGEWRYPFRPYSVPYGMWGPQLPQVVGGMPWGVGHFPAGPMPGGPMPGGAMPPGWPPAGGAGIVPTPGGGFGVGPWNGLSPTQDDYYPQAPIYSVPEPTYSPYSPGLK